MFYWNWLNDALDWGDHFNELRKKTGGTTTTSYTTTYDGKEFVVKDNITGNTLKLDKASINTDEGKTAYKMFMEGVKHEDKPKIEEKKSCLAVGDTVYVTNINEAYVDLYELIEKHPNLALYYQYHTTPDADTVYEVKMVCPNTFEEGSHNRYIYVIADGKDRIFLVGDTGLAKW